MHVRFYHLQLNVSDLTFYSDLFAYLDYRILDRGDDHLGVTDGTTAIWVFRVDAKYARLPYHRKAPGLNHLAFRVLARADVDRFCAEFLRPRQVPPLYGGPCEYSKYRAGYYAVYFEDPDRIKLEVVFVPEWDGQ